MKVLVLLKHDNRDEWLINYLKQIISKEESKITLLNIVVTPQEVPTKSNGQVLDFCTEYDLDGYYKESEDNSRYLRTVLEDYNVVNRLVKVGRPIAIIESIIESESFDLVLSGSHVTSAFEDRAIETFSTRLLKHTKAPYLTIKCNREGENVASIAMVREFESPKQENLHTLNRIRSITGAKICLIKIKTPSDKLEDADFIENMNKFCELNNLEADKLIINASSKEVGVKQIAANKMYDLIALGALNNEHGLFHLSGNITLDILHHVENPLLIY